MIAYQRRRRFRYPGLGAVENDTWPSTGALETETESLRLSVMQLARSIFDAVAVPSDDWQNAWNTFVADFNQWRDSGYFWNPTRRDELLEYRKRFNALLAQFQNIGIGSAVTTTNATPTQVSPLQQASALITKVGWVLAIGAVAYVGITVYRDTRILWKH